MFCSSCGAEYAQKINYCKRCGTNLAPVTNAVEVHLPRLRLAGMFWAVSSFSLIGLITCFVTFTSLADRGLRDENLLLPFMFGLFFVMAISGLLTWQLGRLISVFRHTTRTQPIESPPQSLPQYQAPPALATPAEPISSISEHTTRSFDPTIYQEAEKRKRNLA